MPNQVSELIAALKDIAQESDLSGHFQLRVQVKISERIMRDVVFDVSITSHEFLGHYDESGVFIIDR